MFVSIGTPTGFIRDANLQTSYEVSYESLICSLPKERLIEKEKLVEAIGLLEELII